MAIRGYHAHIYFDPEEVEQARAFAEAAHAAFGVPVGKFHMQPVGRHPRGSCQLTLRADQFGPFAEWASEARDGLTIFAHGLSGDDLTDHTRYIVWFGTSETLYMSAFD